MNSARAVLCLLAATSSVPLVAACSSSGGSEGGGTLHAGIAARTAEIAETIAAEVGMPIALSTMIQAGLPTLTFGSAALDRRLVREDSPFVVVVDEAVRTEHRGSFAATSKSRTASG